MVVRVNVCHDGVGVISTVLDMTEVTVSTFTSMSRIWVANFFPWKLISNSLVRVSVTVVRKLK